MNTPRDARIRVSVLYALPDRQECVDLVLPAGATAAEAVIRSGLQTKFALRESGRLALGCYGRVVTDSYLLRDGDRIEILRPLRHDPRDARRRLAAQGLTMDRRTMSRPR